MYQISQLQLNKNPNKRNGLSATSSQLFYLKDISVKFNTGDAGPIHALSSIQLSIERGEILFITGSSGAGKTTLLKVLSGYLQADGGKLDSPCLERKGPFIAKVFQDLRLMEKATLAANLDIAYDPSLYSKRADFEQDKKELCRILGISDRLGLKVKDANGGLKQKVAVIRALLCKPDVLIADEPTCSLDVENAKKIFDVLSLYNTKRGLTVIWASHNRELVKQFTGRIVHLDAGKLVYSGHACFI